VVLFAPDGKRSRPSTWLDHGFPGFVRGLAAGSAGSVYVTTSAGDVAAYHPVTRAVQTLASNLHELLGVAATADGAVVVAEAGEGRVLQISPGGETTVLARGLGRPAGVAVAADGSIYVSDAGNGRVVQVQNGTTTVMEGLQSPQGIAVAGDQLFVLDVGKKEVVELSLTTKHLQTVVTGLPVGAAPGIVPKPLPGIPGLIVGPLSPFAGLAVGRDGTLYIAGDGEGSVLALKRLT
jgi:DNA-binding beta-propeller fold protein YncE